jgi:hypothetical protein
MSSPETMYSTAFGYQSLSPAMQWLEKRLPLGRLFHAEFAAYRTIAGEVLTTAKGADVLYIGLGDQFDDDRRLVRDVRRELRRAVRVPRRPIPPTAIVVELSYLKSFARRGT